MLNRAPNAQFSCSMALDTDNFFMLVEAAASSIQGRSGVDEFARIFDTLIDRAPKGKAKRLTAPMFAVESRRLLDLKGPGRSWPAMVTALSPSDGTIKLALNDIAQWVPKPGDSQIRMTNRAPNRTSVALWIEVGSRRVLLGADLEHTGVEGEGWIAVLASHKDPNPATVFKVPHHGSANADCPEVWTTMLVQNPIAIVTPFNGGAGLPQLGDLRRLARRTRNLYCTASGPGRPPARDSLVEKTARRVASERRVIDRWPGHVRVRWSVAEPDASPTVELFNGAYAFEGSALQ